MAKKGVYKISGNTKPTVGKKEFYIVDQWYPATPLSDRNLAKVTWELFIKTDNGFRSTNVKKKGINHFTFGKMHTNMFIKLKVIFTNLKEILQCHLLCIHKRIKKKRL